MKPERNVAIRALTLVLIVSLLCTPFAFAAECRYGAVTYTAGNDPYLAWSSVYVDGGSKYRAATWIQAGGNHLIPAHCAGTNGRLFGQNGQLLKETGMQYNTASVPFLSSTTSATTGCALVYSVGEITLYNGTGYVTYDAPEAVTTPAGTGTPLAATVAALASELVDGQYPTNELGQTYGSALLAHVVGAKPELIYALGAHDTPGYVRADELSPGINHPEEAAAYMAAREENSTIPLYDVNGNVIGTFEMSECALKTVERMSLKEAQAAVEAARYPQNSKGETYGNRSMANALGYEAELIAAVGTEGQSGYVRNSELRPHQITTLEEAAAYMKNRPNVYMVSLYDQEGNVIGEFEVGYDVDLSERSFDSIEEAQQAVEAAGRD